MKRILPLAVLALSACAPVIVGGAVTGGLTAQDQRTIGSQVEDQGIELKAAHAIGAELGGKGDYEIVSFNRRVLIVGQAPTSELRERAEAIVAKIDNIERIFNEIEIGGAASAVSFLSDSAITARVKTALCQNQAEGFSCLRVKVVTERGVVYLLGVVTRANGDVAVDSARKVSGVLRVVRAFEYRN